MTANNSGKTAEQLIACVMKENGFIFKRHYKICKSIYEHDIYIDFFIENVEGYPGGLAIECKWQDVSGSVDEKFPYLVLNIKEQFPCPVVIMIDGKGQRDGSIKWLKSKIDDKLIGVYSISEFVSWILRDIKPAL